MCQRLQEQVGGLAQGHPLLICSQAGLESLEVLCGGHLLSQL